MFTQLLLSLAFSIKGISCLPEKEDFNPYVQVEENLLGENQYFRKGLPLNQVSENLNIFIPTSITNGMNNTKSYPLIVFYSGFGSNLPTRAYGSVLKEMASKISGAVVVAWDGLGESNPLDLNGVIDKTTRMLAFFKNGGLQNLIDKYFQIPVNVNTEEIFFAGHSSGSQIAVLMAKQFQSLGLILLDPVDSDPVKWTKPVITVPLVKFTKPVLVVASGLCEARGIQAGNIVPPCCPKNFSSEHFYDGFPSSPRFYLNATRFGHADLLSPDPLAWAGHLSHFCATVENPRRYPFQSYRDFVSGSVAAFVAALGGERNCTMFDFLMKGELFNIEASHKYSLGSSSIFC